MLSIAAAHAAQCFLRKTKLRPNNGIIVGGGKVRGANLRGGIMRGTVRACEVGCDWSVASRSPRTLPIPIPIFV